MLEEKDIYREALAALERGETLDSLRGRFSKAELEEAGRVFSALAHAKRDIVPDANALRDAVFKENRAVSLASIAGVNWRIAVPLGAFAVLLLAFVFGAQRFPKPAEEAANLQGGKTASPEWGNGSVAALEEPLPKATGNVDDAVAALFADMEQESAALGSQADAEISVAESEYGELNSFNYGETQI